MGSESRRKTFGLCMEVESFLRRTPFPEGFDGIFRRTDGRSLSPAEAMTFLQIEKAKGRKVIPCSAECGNPCPHRAQGCAGFDYGGGGCPGRHAPEPAGPA